MAFVFSGEDGNADISNHGKPKEINFYSFARKISNVIGKFDLVASEPKNSLCNPYEFSKISKNGKDIGYIARLHTIVQNDFDLYRTYVCEIDFNKLPFEKTQVKPYSNFQAISRDLSLLIPSSMQYSKIKEHIERLEVKNLINFSAVDLYESEDLGESKSLTVKFTFQANSQTLKDEDINKAIEYLLDSLKNEFGIEIR